MTTTPPRPRRTTDASKRQGEYLERHDRRQVGVHISNTLHAALLAAGDYERSYIQRTLTQACAKYYDSPRAPLPPLVAMEVPSKDTHRYYTWYADTAMHKKIRTRAAQHLATMQQLIISALINFTMDEPPIKALIDNGTIQLGAPPALQGES